MKCATFNVLADAYIGYGDYSHVNSGLLLPGARIAHLVQLINKLDIDIVGLQEVEEPLKRVLDATGGWQTLWAPKERNRPDGCLTLVKCGIEVRYFDSHPYSDGSGHVFQVLRIGQVVFANTHIKWAPADSADHAGIAQATELLQYLGAEQPAVIFADCNDRPNGPVRQLITQAGFVNASEDEPTAIVNRELVALDLLAVRGIKTRHIPCGYDLSTIPNAECPSDHAPIVAELEI